MESALTRREDGRYDWGLTNRLGETYVRTTPQHRGRIARRIMERVFPYAHHIAREILAGPGWKMGTAGGLVLVKFPHRKIDVEFGDLAGEGILQVKPALNRYVPGRSSFSYHLGNWMSSGMRSYLLRTQGAVKVSSWVYDWAKVINELSLTEAVELLAEKHPQIGVDGVAVASSVLKNLQRDQDIHSPVGRRNAGSGRMTFEGLHLRSHGTNPISPVIRKDMKRIVRDCVDSLSDRERDLIQMRYAIGREKLTLDEAGKAIGGVTRERARQIQVKALRELHNQLYEWEIDSLDDVI